MPNHLPPHYTTWTEAYASFVSPRNASRSRFLTQKTALFYAVLPFIYISLSFLAGISCKCMGRTIIIAFSGYRRSNMEKTVGVNQIHCLTFIIETWNLCIITLLDFFRNFAWACLYTLRNRFGGTFFNYNTVVWFSLFYFLLQSSNLRGIYKIFPIALANL